MDKEGLAMRIHRAQGIEELERKKAIHSWVHALSYEREEFDRLWVNSKNATWGHNFGRMVGMDEIYYNHTVDETVRSIQETCEAIKTWPEYRGKDFRAVGASGVHCLSEGCIEASEDGLSARGWFMTPGLMGNAAFSHGGKRHMGCLWEYYGCDFVYHDGQWLYLHEHVCPMFGAQYDSGNWGHDMYIRSHDDPSKDEDRGAPCKVTDPGPLSMRYNVYQVVQHLIWECPSPYQTLDDDNSYSPGRNEVI